MQWYLPPQQWAEDVAQLHTLIQDVFGSGGAAPLTYAPCNSGLLEEWSGQFLANVTSLDKSALGAFSFHGYQHNDITPQNIAAFPGINASRQFFEQVYTQDWSSSPVDATQTQVAWSWSLSQ